MSDLLLFRPRPSRDSQIAIAKRLTFIHGFSGVISEHDGEYRKLRPCKSKRDGGKINTIKLEVPEIKKTGPSVVMVFTKTNKGISYRVIPTATDVGQKILSQLESGFATGKTVCASSDRSKGTWWQPTNQVFVPSSIRCHISWKYEASSKEIKETEIFLPSEQDCRKKMNRTIVRREGQDVFHDKIMAAYEGVCAVTGCEVIQTLQAAHILKYNGKKSNHITNGILLRSDIHLLFDCNLIRIHPQTLAVEFAEGFDSEYYAFLKGKILNLPKSVEKQPSRLALTKRWESTK